MADSFLDKIVAHKKNVVRDKKPYFNKIKETITKTIYSRYGVFKRVLAEPGRVHLIAEVKKASPSKGIIRENFDGIEIAKIYEKSGAAALSILTEEKFFYGKHTLLKTISDTVNIPTLMKDFVIDEGQIYEAFYNGASAILLIMAILSNEQVRYFKEVACSLDMDCLVEVHDQHELDRAIDCGAEIIGVNNRDLTTFDVDIKTSETLIPQIPKQIITVAESGLSSHDDIKRLESIGVNAVLIGETFMREENIEQKVKEVMYGKN